MKTSIVSILFLLFFFAGCTPATYNDDPLWNEVTGYFTDTARTKKELIDKISPEALTYLLGQNNKDTAQEIRKLFASYKEDHNYEIRKTPDSVYICFNPDVEVAGGPVFWINKNDTSWKVMDVEFGK